MKSFRIDDEAALSEDRVLQAIYAPSLGKRSRSDVVKVLTATEEYIEKIQHLVISGEYKPRRHQACVINEKGPHKQRTIIKPDYYPEQIVHHIAVDSIKEAVLHGMDPFVLGSIPGRGAHYGKKYIQKWIRHDPKNTKVIGKLDIRHFFQSIDHNILRAWIHKKIRPGVVRDLIDVIIEASDEGIPLGYYTSQWLANFLLQPLDHYIKEELHIPHMTRYIDDIVIFGSSKKQIHEAVEAIDRYVWEQFRLTIKPNWQVFRLAYDTTELAITCPTMAELYSISGTLWSRRVKYKLKLYRGQYRIFITEKTYQSKKPFIDELIRGYRGKVKRLRVQHGRPLDYMGFKFFRNRTTLRKSILLSATRKAKQIKRSARICWKQAAAMLSYMGWIDHTSTYGVFTARIAPFVSIRRLKRVVSKHARRESHGYHLEKDRRLSVRGTGCA